MRCDIGAVEADACGNGLLDGGETCDDGNTTAGDGCSAACGVENCYACTGEPSSCTFDNGASCEDGDPCTTNQTCSGGVCGGGYNVCLLNHYQCYQGKDLRMPKFIKSMLAVTDQVGDETVELQKVKFVCNPVDKAGEGIHDPNADLTCYQIRRRKTCRRAPPASCSSTQFQESRFEAKKGKLLCLPSAKSASPVTRPATPSPSAT